MRVSASAATGAAALPKKAAAANATATAKGGGGGARIATSRGSSIKAQTSTRCPALVECPGGRKAREGDEGGGQQAGAFVPDARADTSASPGPLLCLPCSFSSSSSSSPSAPIAAAGNATTAAETACLDALQESYRRACARASGEKEAAGDDEEEEEEEKKRGEGDAAAAGDDATTTTARRQRVAMAREELHWGLQRYCPQAQALQDLWLRLRQGDGAEPPLRLLAPSLAAAAAPLPPADLSRAQAAAASAGRARLLQEWLPRAAAALAAPSRPLRPANNDASGFWRAVGAQAGVQLRGLVDEELAALSRAVAGAAAASSSRAAAAAAEEPGTAGQRGGGSRGALLELEVVAVAAAAVEGEGEAAQHQPLALALRPGAAEAREALLAAVDAVASCAAGLPPIGEGVVRAAAAAAGAARAAAAAAEVAAAAAAAAAAEEAADEEEEEDEEDGSGEQRAPAAARAAVLLKRPPRLRGFRPPADRARQVQVVTAAAFEASLEAAKAATAEAAQRQGGAGGGGGGGGGASRPPPPPPPPLLCLDPSKDAAFAAARAAIVRATEPDMVALQALVVPRLAPLVRELDGLMLPTGPSAAAGGAAATAAATATAAAAARVAAEAELARRHAAPFVGAVERTLAVRPSSPGNHLISTSATAAALAACGAEVARLRAAAAAGGGRGQAAGHAAGPLDDDVPSAGGVCVLRCGALKLALAEAGERGAAAVLRGVADAARAACDGAVAEYVAAHASLLPPPPPAEATAEATAEGVLQLHRAIARCSGAVAAAHACPSTGVLARVALARAFLFEQRWPGGVSSSSSSASAASSTDDRPEETTASRRGDSAADTTLAWVEAARWPARLAEELARARTRAAAERRALERALAARGGALRAEAAAAVTAAGDAALRRGLPDVARREAVAAEIEALLRRLDAAVRDLHDMSAERAALLLEEEDENENEGQGGGKEAAAGGCGGLGGRLARARDLLAPHAELWSCVCETHARLTQWTGAPIARVDAREARDGASRLQARLSAVERAFSSSSTLTTTPARQVLADMAARLAAFCEGPELPLLIALRPPPPARPLPDALWAALNREAGLDLNRGEAVSLRALVAFCGSAAAAGRLTALAASAGA